MTTDGSAQGKGALGGRSHCGIYLRPLWGSTWTNLRVFGCVVKVPHWWNHEMISHLQNHAMMTKTTLTSKLVLPFLFYIYLEALTRRKEI